MVSETFLRRQVDLYGQRGAEWLEWLPSLVAECEQRWDLRVQPPFADLTYNYVAPALCADGREVVFKAGVPNPELWSEIAALKAYGGRGVVRLVEADPEQGVLLLERLKPGKMLVHMSDDEQATRIAAAVMRQLCRPVATDHKYPTVNRWFLGLERLRQAFDGGVGPFPRKLVERAESLVADLFASMGAPVLLHGDLHHYNILSAEREPWLAIDPKGVVGEAEYEVGAFMRNPVRNFFHRPDPKGTLIRRVEILCEELGYARERILGWSMAQAVLSAWWTYEEEQKPSVTFLRFAQVLSEIK